MSTPQVHPAAPPRTAPVIVAFLVGALVAVGLGVYGRVHEPTFFSINVAGFSSPTAVKTWLATLAGVLALVQLVSAAGMYGRLPGLRTPSWIGTLHVWSGRLAVLATVPVAVHCLYALGFRTGEPRVLWHSLAGCLLYGAFVTKMLLLSRRGLPGWAVPVAGGVLFTAIVVVWTTSALYFFRTTGITF